MPSDCSIDPSAVSIVLPVYNAALTLDDALESIQAQTFQAWELVLVDDGSTDDSAERATARMRSDPRLRLLRLSHRGLVPALQVGLAAARRPLIARMDADDWMHPDRLQEQVRYLHEHPEIGVVGCQVDFGGDPAAQAGYSLHVEWLNRLLTPAAIARERFIESPLAHPSVLFRRALLEPFGGYAEGPFPEDYELWLRWLDAGVKMAKVPRVLLTWRDGPNRLSRTDPRYGPEAFYALKARWLARELERHRRGRSLWIWGAGRPTRLRAALLEHHGQPIAGYIDIDPRKQGRVLQGRRVVGPEAIPSPETTMVAGYVAKRGAHLIARTALGQRGFVEGEDFWLAA